MMTYVLRKNSLEKLGFFLFFILLLTSCVTTKEDLLYLNDQIVAINTRVSKVEESVNTSNTRLSNEFDSRLASVRERQAELGSEIDTLRGEIRDLSGLAEENNRLLKRAIERDTTEQDLMKAKLAGLVQRLAELEASLKRLNEYLGLEPSGKIGEQGQKEGPSVAKEPPRQPPQVFEEKPLSPEKQLYDLTLATYKKEEFEGALAGFKNFLEKYPNSDLADNAQFWIGECYMALKQYEKAILAYQEVIKKYPKGNKVPNAMLRQALAFYEIKDKISSRLLLKKILKNYPNSSEAKIAEARLKSLN